MTNLTTLYAGLALVLTTATTAAILDEDFQASIGASYGLAEQTQRINCEGVLEAAQYMAGDLSLTSRQLIEMGFLKPSFKENCNV